MRHQCSVIMYFAVVNGHSRREIAPVSIGTRAILRVIRRDFGAQDAHIDRKTCAIIVGSRCASRKLDL